MSHPNTYDKDRWDGPRLRRLNRVILYVGLARLPSSDVTHQLSMFTPCIFFVTYGEYIIYSGNPPCTLDQAVFHFGVGTDHQCSWAPVRRNINRVR